MSIWNIQKRERDQGYHIIKDAPTFLMQDLKRCPISGPNLKFQTTMIIPNKLFKEFKELSLYWQLRVFTCRKPPSHHHHWELAPCMLLCVLMWPVAFILQREEYWWALLFSSPLALVSKLIASTFFLSVLICYKNISLPNIKFRFCSYLPIYPASWEWIWSHM